MILLCPLEGAPFKKQQLPCINWLVERHRVDLRWTLCFEGTADEMLDHSEKGMTWKSWHLAVHSLPSFPEICEHVFCIWIQTELSNPQYVTSCIIAVLLSSVCQCISYVPMCFHLCYCIINAVFTHLVRMNDFLSRSIHVILSCHQFPHVSIINLTSSDESSFTTCSEVQDKSKHFIKSTRTKCFITKNI